MPLRLTLALLVLLIAAVIVSLVEGTPTDLPGVALGSPVLLHAIRAIALFALGLGVLTVLARAATGALPTQLSSTGIAYENDQELTAAVAELQDQVAQIDSGLEELARRLDADTDTA